MTFWSEQSSNEQEFFFLFLFHDAPQLGIAVAPSVREGKLDSRKRERADMTSLTPSTSPEREAVLALL